MNETEQNVRKEYEKRQALRRAARRRKERRQALAFKVGLCILGLLICGITGYEVIRMVKGRKTDSASVRAKPPKKVVVEPPEYEAQLLTVNEYSRPGEALKAVNGVVVHYTANPGTTAQQNRDYFEGLGLSGETYASSHFVIGIDGELIQCIPCDEIAYASNDRNADTISIECCIPDESGKFSDATYATLVHLTAWLMGRHGLGIDGVIRHYDVTGKACPKYYVEYQTAWEQLKEDIEDYIEQNGTTEPQAEEKE